MSIKKREYSSGSPEASRLVRLVAVSSGRPGPARKVSAAAAAPRGSWARAAGRAPTPTWHDSPAQTQLSMHIIWAACMHRCTVQECLCPRTVPPVLCGRPHAAGHRCLCWTLPRHDSRRGKADHVSGPVTATYAPGSLNLPRHASRHVQKY
jgi:hypothetical protein